MITENLQKRLFRENEKSLLHLLNNLAAVLPVFSRKGKGTFWQRCTVLIWLSCALHNRLLGVRMNSCDLPQLLTQDHPQDSASWLPALSTSLSSSDMVWITIVTTSQASRAVVSVIGIPPWSRYLNAIYIYIGQAFLKERSTASQQRQQHSKILAKYCHWWVTFAELIWCLPENCSWTVNKILNCVHYLEDYSWCAVSS